MMRRQSLVLAAMATAMAIPASSGIAQQMSKAAPPPKVDAKQTLRLDSDTVVLPASKKYEAGAFHRMMLGDNYRDLWATPIKVAVLNLSEIDGGLKATEQGGGNQTKSLRLLSKGGREYTFRPIYKERLVLPGNLDGTVVEDIFADGLSGSHPTAPLISDPILTAVGVVHPRPKLYVMGDSPLLGEFREDYAGKLGTLEEHVSKPEGGVAFANATDVIDSDELLEKLNKDPRQRVDSRQLLKARLIDFLVNDNDRHRDQWKWIRMEDDPRSPWIAVPRDRDKVFVSHEGFLLRVARVAKPNLVSFEGTYPNLSALAGKVMQFDSRLLAGLDRADWQSVAREVAGAITDSVIDEAMRAMPAEYAPKVPELRAKLRSRRNLLPDAALRYYGVLAQMVDLHGSDEADVASIRRLENGEVEIAIRSGSSEPYFERRFIPGETREIRVYLHGGNDSAVVSGPADRSIVLRVIGGSGTNSVVDPAGAARHYDVGTIDSVRYKPDSAFNRKPWFEVYGKEMPPDGDYGSKIVPIMGMKTGRGLGVVPRIGFTRYVEGFRMYPYRSMVRVEGEYATAVGGFAVGLATDNRFEGSRWHILSESEATQLEVGHFRGFGNDLPNLQGVFYDVRQHQFSVNPALGFALSPRSDISLGPIVRYTRTDSLANRFVSEEAPLGFPRFGQVGLQFGLTHDIRDSHSWPTSGTRAEMTARYFPALWDVESPYGTVEAVASTYYQLRMPKDPVLAMRVGGHRAFGDFPYFDAASLGGSKSLRHARRQRYAGDASLYGNLELRVPLAKFGFILPLDVGMFGYGDVGRVWLDGRSPGPWHSSAGGGLWLGVLNPSTSLTVTMTNSRERRVLLGIGTSY
jgi:hypothetical protein